MARLESFTQNCAIIGDVRGRGLMFGVEIVSDKAQKTAAPDLAETIYYKCLDKGLSFKISQGCVLTLSPPLNIARNDLDAALTIVETAISEAV
jgi:4-aminobutyrate aminotransferase